MLQHEGHTDATQLFALRGVAPALVEVGEICKLQRLVDDRREIAAVVGVDWRLEWHRRRRNKVFLAQPYRIHADNPRRFFHHTLERVVGFRPSGAPIGPDRDGIAEVTGDRDVDLRDSIHARQAAGEVVRVNANARGADIGTLVAQMPHPQRQEFTVLVEREFYFRDGVARLRVCDKSLRARRLPLHGPAELSGGNQQCRIFGIDRSFHAERAADIVRDHAQLFVWHAHNRSALCAQRVGTLRTGVERVAVVRLVIDAGGPTGFH